MYKVESVLTTRFHGNAMAEQVKCPELQVEEGEVWQATR